MAEFSTNLFTVDAKQKTFITEASDLGRSTLPINHRLYQDACDMGITLRSQNTDKVSTWYEHEEERSNDEDNELLATIYKPTFETIRKFPQLKDWTVVILND